MQEYMPCMPMSNMQNNCCPMMDMQSNFPMMGMPSNYPMMGMPSNFPVMGMSGNFPMMEMPQEQLESMYPEMYHVVHPHVKNHCDMFDSKYGMMHTPKREQLESMTDDICRKVEVDVDILINTNREGDDRQIGFGGRRVLRDLVSILLIRELINRRRRPTHFGGFPGGFGGGFGGIY